jgi:cell division protein FtsQ
MSRLSATARPAVSRPALSKPRPRVKKAAIPQDRLTARKLFFRRVRRSMKPGLWLLGLGAVLVVGSELFRSVSAIVPPPAATPAPTPSPAPHHSGFGLAQLAADFGLRITKVEISGAQTTDPAQLAQAIGVQPGTPTLGFSLAAVQARVAQLGPVQSVTIQRELPGTLRVSITERAAYAIWQTGGNGRPTQFMLIDKSGNVIPGQDAALAKRREPSLVLLVGTDAPQNAQPLMTELQADPAVLSHVAAAERVDGLRWDLVLKDQTVVKLPTDNAQDAIDQLATLQASLKLLDRPVEDIDMRLPGKLVVHPYPTAPATPAAKDQHT